MITPHYPHGLPIDPERFTLPTNLPERLLYTSGLLFMWNLTLSLSEPVGKKMLPSAACRARQGKVRVVTFAD